MALLRGDRAIWSDQPCRENSHGDDVRVERHALPFSVNFSHQPYRENLEKDGYVVVRGLLARDELHADALAINELAMLEIYKQKKYMAQPNRSKINIANGEEKRVINGVMQRWHRLFFLAWQILGMVSPPIYDPTEDYRALLRKKGWLVNVNVNIAWPGAIYQNCPWP